MAARNFTLRLSESEESALGGLKKVTKEVTDAGAIKHAIRTYAELTQRYNAEIEKNIKLNRELNEVKQKVNRYCCALNDLNSI